MSEECEPAIVKGITLCDTVIREHGTGKCSLIGIFHGLQFPSFPALMRPFYVNIALTNLHGHIKEMNMTCRIERTDSAHVVSSIAAKFGTPDEKAVFTPMMAFDLPFPFPNVMFPAAGGYSIVVLADGEELDRRRIEVISLMATGIPGSMG